MKSVSAFLNQAGEIFETACHAGQANEASCDWAITVSPEGGIHMMSAAGWNTEPLRLHMGARTAYRVSRRHGEVVVEGRSGRETCNLRSQQPQRALVGALNFPQYITV